MTEEGFRDVALGILVRDGRILLVERDWEVNEFPGMAAFPGGDVDGKEHPIRGVVRMFEEETGVPVDVHRKLGKVLQRLQFPDGSYEDYRLHVYEMRQTREALLTEHAFWTDVDRMEELDIVPSDLTIFKELYEKRASYDEHDRPRFVSGIVKDRRGDYAHVEFEQWDQGA